ncbi:unnamed protein product [Bodo saltans]|uniref:Uncharacterized protein n=1 Tax=Bodo saltans TaxID=75058 RepID=A0A0S4JHL2_BODSA|nr:unnamed protein product [Bodo saltans]|eukprot:CUG90978.1 unnamed protein product [Bodo saltans]
MGRSRLVAQHTPTTRAPHGAGHAPQRAPSLTSRAAQPHHLAQQAPWSFGVPTKPKQSTAPQFGGKQQPGASSPRTQATQSKSSKEKKKIFTCGHCGSLMSNAHITKTLKTIGS